MLYMIHSQIVMSSIAIAFGYKVTMAPVLLGYGTDCVHVCENIYVYIYNVCNV